VTEAMNHPLLQNFVAACVGVHSAAVASASSRLSLADRNPKICRRIRLRNDLIPIDGVDGQVSIPVEYDCANGAASRQTCAPARMAANADGMSLAAPQAKPE